MAIDVRVIGLNKRLDKTSDEPFESYRKILRGLDCGEIDPKTHIAHPTTLPNRLNAVLFGIRFGLDHQLLSVPRLDRDPKSFESEETVLGNLAQVIEDALPRQANGELRRPEKLLLIGSVILLNRLVEFRDGHELNHTVGEETLQPVHYFFQTVSP